MIDDKISVGQEIFSSYQIQVAGKGKSRPQPRETFDNIENETKVLQDEHSIKSSIEPTFY